MDELDRLAIRYLNTPNRVIDEMIEYTVEEELAQYMIAEAFDTYIRGGYYLCDECGDVGEYLYGTDIYCHYHMTEYVW